MAGLLCLALLQAAVAGDIEITAVEPEIRDGVHLINLDARIPLSDDMQEAVQSGVPLRFVFDLQLLKRRRLLWDSRILAQRRAFRLERHALAGKYVVLDEQSGNRQVLSSLEDAVEALGQIREVAVASVSRIPEGARIRIRIKLDIEGLPAPMRPIAYLSPSWYLGSGWYSWEVEP